MSKTAAKLGVFILGCMAAWPGVSVVAQSLPSSSAGTSFPLLDGPVYSILETNGTLYVGGRFRQVGNNTGGGGILSTTTGLAEENIPRLNGFAYASVADGNGGWFIGGTFDTVGAIPRKNLAHIRADRTVDPNWNPGATGGSETAVRALWLVGGVLYVGGSFDSLGGQPRGNAGAVDATSGAVTAWAPNPSGKVFALAVRDQVVFAGGSFTNAGGQARTNVAALNATTGLATDWKALPGDTVRAFELGTTNLFIGGSFTNINGIRRINLASLDLATAKLWPWAPPITSTFMYFDGSEVKTVSPEVHALKRSETGTMIFAGGRFSANGRPCVAAFNAGTGGVTTWGNNGFFFQSSEVNTLALANGRLFVGGDFTFTDNRNVSRSNIVALASSNGATVNGWNGAASGGLATITVSSNSLFVGGQVGSVGMVGRANLAAFDRATGSLKAWAPNPSGAVRAMLTAGGILYIAGDFQNVNSFSRNRLAGIDLQTGAVTSWAPITSGTVNALARSDDTLFVGGAFTQFGGLPRNRVAALSLSTAAVLDWVADVGGAAGVTVNALTILGDRLFIGGNFTSLNGAKRANLGAVNLFTATVQDWSPATDGVVSTLYPEGNVVYAGGAFTKVGFSAHDNVVAIGADTGKPTTWNAGTDGRVTAITASADAIYLGGSFVQVAGQPRAGAAAVDRQTGALLAWHPNFAAVDVPAAVQALLVNGDRLYAGGDFAQVNGTPAPGFAAFPFVADGGERRFRFDSARVLAGGQFQAGITVEGGSFLIQVSEDLVQWTTLKTVAAGESAFGDAASTTTKRRFYRAIPSP